MSDFVAELLGEGGDPLPQPKQKRLVLDPSKTVFEVGDQVEALSSGRRGQVLATFTGPSAELVQVQFEGTSGELIAMLAKVSNLAHVQEELELEPQPEAWEPVVGGMARVRFDSTNEWHMPVHVLGEEVLVLDGYVNSNGEEGFKIRMPSERASTCWVARVEDLEPPEPWLEDAEFQVGDRVQAVTSALAVLERAPVESEEGDGMWKLRLTTGALISRTPERLSELWTVLPEHREEIPVGTLVEIIGVPIDCGDVTGVIGEQAKVVELYPELDERNHYVGSVRVQNSGQANGYWFQRGALAVLEYPQEGAENE